MMNDHQTALVSLLLGSFPNFQSGDGEAALAAYEIVLNQGDERDLQPGVMMLINGEVAGHDGRFAPTAPQLAKAIRQAMNKRLDNENRRRTALPKPDDFQQDPPEVRARNKAKLDALAASLSDKMTMDFEPLRRLQERTNARFDPAPVSYSVGDPDAEGDMGGLGERVA